MLIIVELEHLVDQVVEQPHLIMQVDLLEQEQVEQEIAHQLVLHKEMMVDQL